MSKPPGEFLSEAGNWFGMAQTVSTPFSLALYRAPLYSLRRVGDEGPDVQGLHAGPEGAHQGIWTPCHDGGKDVGIRPAPGPDLVAQAGSLASPAARTVANRAIAVIEFVPLFDCFRTAVQGVGDDLGLTGYGGRQQQAENAGAQQSAQASRRQSPTHDRRCQAHPATANPKPTASYPDSLRYHSRIRIWKQARLTIAPVSQRLLQESAGVSSAAARR